VSYLARASPLHAARAAPASAYCASLLAAILLTHHPLLLAALALAIAIAAAGARVPGRVARSLCLSLPMAVAVALINALVSRNGLTVLARFGDWGPFGQVDPTLEALAYGATFGLQLTLTVALCALWSAAIDPDALLRSLRRVSFRSALTATLATRMVPLLAYDAQRISEAQRTRRRPAQRAAVARAITTNALDRALDIAATLEVRGYGGAAAPRAQRPPRSRHDIAFAAAALGIVALATASAALDLAPFAFYPTFHGALVSTGSLAIGLTFVALAGAPFTQRRGIER
jgi:energy-coupling factor transport system permease protein